MCPRHMSTSLPAAVRPSLHPAAPRRRAAPPPSRGTRAPKLRDAELLNLATEWEADASVLRRHGDERVAQVLEECAHRLRLVGAEFSEWLSEEAAARRAGWTTDQVRRHARKFVHTEHVIRESGKFRLRAVVIPRLDPSSSLALGLAMTSAAGA